MDEKRQLNRPLAHPRVQKCSPRLGACLTLFSDVLPYAVGTPATYGFAGFNGRTPADNAGASARREQDQASLGVAA